jgi:integrase/recombinase XerD
MEGGVEVYGVELAEGGEGSRYWLQRFLWDLEAVRSHNTVRAYRQDLCRWMDFCEEQGTAPLVARTRDVIGFVREERGRLTHAGERISARTVVRRLAAVRRWYEFLCLEPESTGVWRNPVPRGASLRAATGAVTGQSTLLRYDQEYPELLSPREMDSFLANLDVTRYRDKAVAWLLKDGALRIHEALGLRTGDLHWAGRRITVRAAKSHSSRTVPLTREALAVLGAYIRLERPARLEHDYVFVCLGRRSFGEPFNYRAWVYVCEKAREKAGTPRVHAHAFRHTQATNLAEAGMPLDSLRRMLGHRHLDTTLVYDQIRNDRLRREYEEVMGEDAAGHATGRAGAEPTGGGDPGSGSSGRYR